MPKVTGGKGDGQNPEQLFAMGYSCEHRILHVPDRSLECYCSCLPACMAFLACFLGALQLAAARADKMEIAEKARVTANVFLGHPSEPDVDGFGLRVEIHVEGCDDDAVIAAAHDVRVSYSRLSVRCGAMLMMGCVALRCSFARIAVR